MMEDHEDVVEGGKATRGWMPSTTTTSVSGGGGGSGVDTTLDSAAVVVDREQAEMGQCRFTALKANHLFRPVWPVANQR